MAGLIGKKIGMTRVFTEEGLAVPVTVVEAGPCPVVQVKTPATDGYDAIQLGFGKRKPKRAKKARLGHVAKAGLEMAPAILREFAPDEGQEYELGQELTVELFEQGDAVKVTGTTKGRGFQGGVKRHGFRGRPATHGHPMSRTPAPWAQAQTLPGSSRERSFPVRWETSVRPSGMSRWSKWIRRGTSSS